MEIYVDELDSQNVFPIRDQTRLSDKNMKLLQSYGFIKVDGTLDDTIKSQMGQQFGLVKFPTNEQI